MLFPDLDHLLDAHQDLEERMNVLDKSLGTLEKSVGVLDKSVGLVDKGMVQVHNGLNRLDKEMIRLNKGMDQLNKGMDQLNKDVDEREKDLTIRLENLKTKLEADHARAMGEVASLLETHAFEERNPDSHQELKTALKNRAEIQPGRDRAISELSAALGPQAPFIEALVEPEPDHARALDELAALLSTARRRDEGKREEPRDPMHDEPERFAKASNGHPAPLDFAAILDHIRNREAAV